VSDEFVFGDWNAQCSMCGRKKKASQLVRNWQGQWRCPDHNEQRHPQDFARTPSPEKPPPWVQPQTLSYIPVCDPNSITAISEHAAAGCAIAGYIHPAYDPTNIITM